MTSCPRGYEFTGVACEDIDECDGVHNCDAAAGCINQDGGFTCGSCPAGSVDVYGNGTLCEVEDCKAAFEWFDTRTGESIRPGADALEAPYSGSTYGYSPSLPRRAAFPECRSWDHTVRLPVFMINWEDLDPAVDTNAPHNPYATPLPSYVPATPSELQAYLDGPSGPGAYYADASGGQAGLVLEVIGKYRSDDPGVDLRPYADYVDQWSSGAYYCKSEEVALDVLRTAVRQKAWTSANTTRTTMGSSTASSWSTRGEAVSAAGPT